MFMAIERILILGLAFCGDPIDDWNEAVDLETCETVCHEKEERNNNNDTSSEAEVIVIDLDQIRSGTSNIDIGPGLTIELAHGKPAGSHELIVWIADDEEDLCEVPIPTETEVRPTEHPSTIGPVPNEFRLNATTEEMLLPMMNDDEALPLPAPTSTGRDEKTAQFQRTYQTLLAKGRRAEADALAAQFLAEDEIASVAPVKRSEKPPASSIHHQVGYRPEASSTWVRRYPGSDTARWSYIAHRRITVRLDRTPMDELARFLRCATGLTVDVELPSPLAEELRCQVECNDLPMAEAIDVISRQLQVRIVPHEDRLVIRE